MLGHPQTLNAGQPLGALAGGHKVKHRAYRGVWPGRGRVTPGQLWPWTVLLCEHHLRSERKANSSALGKTSSTEPAHVES